jgi:hypothetical protein
VLAQLLASQYFSRHVCVCDAIVSDLATAPLLQEENPHGRTQRLPIAPGSSRIQAGVLDSEDLPRRAMALSLVWRIGRIRNVATSLLWMLRNRPQTSFESSRMRPQV